MIAAVDPVLLTRAVGFARIGFGILMLARPEVLGSRWIGRQGALPGTRVIVRALGMRDLVLGLGAATASGREQQRWAAASLAADAADLSATLAGGSAVPLAGRLGTAVAAGAGVALGGISLAGLSRPSKTT